MMLLFPRGSLWLIFVDHMNNNLKVAEQINRKGSVLVDKKEPFQI